MKPARIAWVIPCYNEESTIGGVVRDIKTHCPGSEIYVCDNNSSDQTALVAQSQGATVLRETRQGKGFAVKRLFRSVDADIFIMVDGDGTYEIESWRKLADPVLKQERQMSIASRLDSHGKKSFRLFHKLGNRFFSFLIRTLFKAKLSDVLSGYRALSKGFVKQTQWNAKGFEVEVEMTISALRKSISVCEVPLSYRARPKGSYSKLKTVRDGVRILLAILRSFK